MLVTFWLWGLITPGLARRGIPVERLIAWGLPLSFGVIGALVWMGPDVGAGAAVGMALLCVTSTFVALAQPAVGMAFPSHLAGRALSAYNLVIFAGIFTVQWGIGRYLYAMGNSYVQVEGEGKFKKIPAHEYKRLARAIRLQFEGKYAEMAAELETNVEDGDTAPATTAAAAPTDTLPCAARWIAQKHLIYCVMVWPIHAPFTSVNCSNPFLSKGERARKGSGS